MSFSDEDIFAFLLGEADQALNQRIHEQLQTDCELLARVNHLRSMLNHQNGTGCCFEPPSGLVESTIQRMSSDGNCGRMPDLAQGAKSGRCRERAVQPKLSASVCFWKGSFEPQRWFDTIALTISVVSLCCLILPSIVSIRFVSRRLQCENNLRITGRGLTEYARLRPDGRFPWVADSGPESFAGVYALRLHSVGLLDSIGQLRCVSIQGGRRPMIFRLSDFPTLENLNKMPREQLLEAQKTLGGDYAYNLGIVEGKRVVAPKNQGQTHFAILADAPVISSRRVRTLQTHDGRGVNILYDDGHVNFVSSQLLENSSGNLDQPFCNRVGDNEAGLDDRDASLAPSDFSPLGR